jgi:hypothetical protein
MTLIWHIPKIVGVKFYYTKIQECRPIYAYVPRLDCIICTCLVVMLKVDDALLSAWPNV